MGPGEPFLTTAGILMVTTSDADSYEPGFNNLLELRYYLFVFNL